MIKYNIGVSGQLLIFTDRVLNHFNQHRQRRFWCREAGGQLFARLKTDEIIIEEATGPRHTDRRSRTSYEPDRNAEQMEINKYHAVGLHYVGDWHTHAEQIPRPSQRDIDSISDCYRKSIHTLNALVLAIVGQLDVRTALHVSLHDTHGSYCLSLVNVAD